MHDGAVSLLFRLPGLLVRRDPHVMELSRFGRCDSCGRPTVYLKLVDPKIRTMFASWPYSADYLRRCATRENWFCAWCGRSFRMRMLAAVIWQHAQGRDVYQAGRYAVLVGRRAIPSVVVSEYVEDAEPGSVVDGVSRQDLQKLTFPDSSFDLVVTSEVFEHVENPWRAFAEVRRVLRPGGRHIFTVPDTGAEQSRTRDGLPDVFHLDGPRGRSRVVTDFGEDLPELLRPYGFETLVHDFPREDPVTRVFETIAV